MMPLLQAFPFPSTLGEVTLHLFSQACVFIYSSHGKWVFPLSCGVFLPLPLSQAFPLLVAGCTPPLPPSPARPCLFIYSSGRDSCLPPLQHSGHPTLFATCLYCAYCLLLSFSFFPGWRSVCPVGYAYLAQGWLWEYHVPLSSPCPCLPKPSRCGRLVAARRPLGFSIQHEVRCSAQAGGVEGSMFCLFSVALPSRCVSSVSPRFHFRRHTFCFLLLATILESPPKDLDSYFGKTETRFFNTHICTLNFDLRKISKQPLNCSWTQSYIYIKV
jgi:hypothetical protein